MSNIVSIAKTGALTRRDPRRLVARGAGERGECGGDGAGLARRIEAFMQGQVPRALAADGRDEDRRGRDQRLRQHGDGIARHHHRIRPGEQSAFDEAIQRERHELAFVCRAEVDVGAAAREQMRENVGEAEDQREDAGGEQPGALAVLRELLKDADVLVQNLAPGAAARMGLSFEALSPTHPKLIVCDISGYGEDGPYRDKKAYDLLIQSEAGLLSITGTPEAPSKAGNSMADISAGMYAYTNILSALLLRGKTGQGSHIDVSMLEALGEWMGYPLYYAFEGAPPPPRTAASHASIYPYGPFAAGDGGTVMLGLQNEREWKVFCEVVLADAALASDARFCTNALRNENRSALQQLILGVFATMSTAEVEARLDKAQIANARMNDMAGVWAHPQLKARQRWQTVGSPAGDIPALLPPGRNNRYDYRMDAVPAVGEHTEAILRELGLDEAAVQALRNKQAI